MKQVEAGLLEDLYDLLEEEIFQYHLLVEELKKESEHLRRGSVESLTESLQPQSVLPALGGQSSGLNIHTRNFRKTGPYFAEDRPTLNPNLKAVRA